MPLFAPRVGVMAMNGREIFRAAVREDRRRRKRAVAAASLTTDDVDVFVPHQTNHLIVQALADCASAWPATRWST